MTTGSTVLINTGTYPNDGTGDNLITAFTKTNAAIQTGITNTAGIAAGVTSIAGLQAQINATTAGYPTNLNYAQLVSTYNSTSVPTGTYPTVQTVDFGAFAWNGVNWELIYPQAIIQGGIPFINPPAYNLGTNGAITFTVALRIAFTGCYVNIHNPIVPNQASGWYWCVMTSTTQGTLYNNKYYFNQPEIPTTLVPFVGTGAGAVSNVVGSGYLSISANMPANLMGLNGEAEFDFVWCCNNSAGVKSVGSLFGGDNISGSDQETTAQFRAATHYVRNCGSQTIQVAMDSTSGDTGTGTAMNTFSVDTTIGQTMALNLETQATTDWVELTSYSFKISPTSDLDPPIGKVNAALQPAGARALSYAVNKYLLYPQVSDVSISNNVSSKLFAGLYTDATPPSWYIANSSFTTGSDGTLACSLGATFAGIPQNNSLTGALPLVSPATGFYAEWAVRLSDNNQDHWPACWMLPAEHGAGTDFGKNGYPSWFETYCEIDTDEGGYARDPYNPFYGMHTTFIDWSGNFGQVISLTAVPSGTSATLSTAWTAYSGTYPVKISGTNQSLNATVTNGSNAVTFSATITGSPTAGFQMFGYQQILHNNATPQYWGPNIDRTVENIFGVSVDPIAKRGQAWLNGQKNGPSYDLSGFWTQALASYHYYMIFSMQSHGLHLPYTAYVRYISMWTPT